MADLEFADMKLTDEQIAELRDDMKAGFHNISPWDIPSPETVHALATEVLESRAEIARLTKERDEVLEEADAAEYRRYSELRALLSDPNAVHVNMLRGEIAKPSWEQMKHLRPKESAAELTREGDEVDDRHGFGELVASAYAEADKAMRKFPQPNYVISKVAEEAGEVVKAAIHCAEKRETAENVAGEMKQLIAMLYRLWVEGDQVHGLSPIAAAIRALKKSV
jgi:phosphoribosyl-ATP pyrophosphohydrolase